MDLVASKGSVADRRTAAYFVDTLDLKRLIEAPGTFERWTTARKILRVTGDLEPPLAEAQLSWNDYQSLIHFEIGGRISAVEPSRYQLIWQYPDLSPKQEQERIEAVATPRLLALARLAPGPAIDHLTQCTNCSGFPIATQIGVLKNGLAEGLPPPETVSKSVALMGKFQGRLWGSDERYDFVWLLRRLISVVATLPEAYRFSLSDCLLSLSLSYKVPSSRNFEKQGSHLGKLLQPATTNGPALTRADCWRAADHAKRRTRSLYFLMVAVRGDGCEYRYRGATLQDQNGTHDEPACHSLLGDLDRRPPGMGWRFAEHGETFQRYPFFRILASSTVILPAAYNDLDGVLEGAWRPVASNLLTEVAQGAKTTEEAFTAFATVFKAWAAQLLPMLSDEAMRTYIDYHLQELRLFQEDRKSFFAKPDDKMKPFYATYIEPALNNDGTLDEEAAQQLFLSAL